MMSRRMRYMEDITFVVICSVTNSKKVFKTVFQTTTYDLYGRRTTSYATFELKTEQVKSLRDAVAAALSKATPAPAAPAGKTGI